MTKKPTCFEIDSDGILLGVPVWSEKPGAKNWAAAIVVDENAFGGLGRAWLTKPIGGGFYEVPDELAPGDALEFAGDEPADDERPARSRATARRREWSAGKRNRWYGFVVKVTPTELTLMPCTSGPAACRKGLLYRERQLAGNVALSADYEAALKLAGQLVPGELRRLVAELQLRLGEMPGIIGLPSVQFNAEGGFEDSEPDRTGSGWEEREPPRRLMDPPAGYNRR